MTKLPNGLYDRLITEEIERELARIGPQRRFEAEELDPADANVILARHIAAIVREALRGVPESERPIRQADICNEILRSVASALPDHIEDGDYIQRPPRRLASVYPFDAFRSNPPASPEIPLSQSDLLVNARGEPRIGSVLEREISSADRIDLIMAFIRWSGLRLVEPRLRAFIEAGGQLRVITTTYTGSTERRAIEHLIAIGAQVRVSYQTDSTRLHAKAWHFHRESGFSTVFIGSSNLSTSAMVDGVEWNVRLSQTDAPTIVEKFAATFASYWAEPDFELYDPLRDASKFDRAVASATREESTITFVGIEVEPWPHQREILEHLTVERYRHDRWQNLIVAATGTGKTVVAALDYRRLTEEFGRPLSLLFVAHRREILQQSLGMFRTVMRDGSFGELYVDGHRPDEWRHVFASIQSLSGIDPSGVKSDAFDVVIVDEFHHAAAPTYRALLGHLKPKVLLGLTATPERTDGQSVLEWFGGRMAVELRLWDALERSLLSPFHYFGIHDSVDLARVAWRRGRYDERELENIYTANDARVAQVLHELKRKITDIRRMRALGFCVGVHHAEFMAERFRAAGIPSEAVLGTTDSDSRDRALRRLRDREINCVFAVDIFNEGVDVPEIDTVLFLRPTESATVFLQQLGRGLRRARNKECLTVLDFIGNAHRNFRFDLRYRAITGASRRGIEEQVTEGFPYLPAGCSIQLDRESSRIVLENLKQSIGTRFSTLVTELRSLGPSTTLRRFLDESQLDPEDLYRARGWSWTRLRRETFGAEDETQFKVAESAGRADAPNNDEAKLLNALPRLLHLDDPGRITLLREVFAQKATLSKPERRSLEGILITLWGDDETHFESALSRLRDQPAVRNEFLEVLGVLEERSEHLTYPLSDLGESWIDIPLALHARYTLDEVMAAIGRSRLDRQMRLQGGVLWDPATAADYFFITLEKSEKHYSPTTRYRDYAVSPEEFHWESQSVTREASETGQRYINHRQRGSNIFLFVRRTRKLDGNRTAPYMFLGPADYIRHNDERPMAIIWHLRRPMPLDFFKQAKLAAG